MLNILTCEVADCFKFLNIWQKTVMPHLCLKINVLMEK